MKKLVDIVGIIAGLIIAIGPYTFLHVCGDMGMASDMGGMGMDSGAVCHGIPAASLITGILLIVVSLVSIISQIKAGESDSGKLYKFLTLLRIAIGIVTIGIPTFIIGVCNSAHMHCNMVTRPALIIIGAIVGISGVIGLIYQMLKSNDGRVILDEQPQ